MINLIDTKTKLTQLQNFLNKLKDYNYSYETENGINVAILCNKVHFSMISLDKAMVSRNTKILEIQLKDLKKNVNNLYLKASEKKQYNLLRWSLGLTTEHQDVTSLKENYRSSTIKPAIKEDITIDIVFSLIKNILSERHELLSNILVIIKEIAQQKPKLLFQRPDVLQRLWNIRRNVTQENDLKIFETFMTLCKSDEKKLKDILGLETSKKQNNDGSSISLVPHKMFFPTRKAPHVPTDQKSQQQPLQQPPQKKQKLTGPVLCHTQTNTWHSLKPSHRYEASQKKPRI